MRITVLVGGVGGARFLLGARALLAGAGHEVTAVVNVGDDVIMHGLRICPDLDSVMYTLGGGADPERGWGRAGETWTVKEELAAYGVEPTWFGLGDRDIATHLVRTTMINAGYPLSAVTEALCTRWQPGVRILPATDDRMETHAVVELDGGRRAIHFQEWWVRYRGELPTERDELSVQANGLVLVDDRGLHPVEPGVGVPRRPQEAARHEQRHEHQPDQGEQAHPPTGGGAFERDHLSDSSDRWDSDGAVEHRERLG